MSSNGDAPAWDRRDRDVVRAGFDDDADAYDRTRSVAPPVVFDELVRLARLRSGSTVVEVGPGTGQATRALAERGLRVVAVELGAHLAERLHANLADLADVSVENAAFEAWPDAGRRFDAVVAANSLHWVDPAARFAKPAALLRPGGHLVTLSTPIVVPDDADLFWWEVQDDWAAVGSERVDPATKHPDRIGQTPSLEGAEEWFEAPAGWRHRFAVTLRAEDYAANLGTQSAARELPPDARAELLRRVAARIRGRGGTVRVDHLAVLTVARVRPPGG